LNAHAHDVLTVALICRTVQGAIVITDTGISEGRERTMESKFIFAMIMAFVTLLCCASRKTIPIAMITGAIAVWLCCSIVPDVIAAAG
jgi:hypothetical protein